MGLGGVFSGSTPAQGGAGESGLRCRVVLQVTQLILLIDAESRDGCPSRVLSNWTFTIPQ